MAFAEYWGAAKEYGAAARDFYYDARAGVSRVAQDLHERWYPPKIIVDENRKYLDVPYI